MINKFQNKKINESIDMIELYSEVKTNNCGEPVNNSCPSRSSNDCINGSGYCGQVTNVKSCS